MEEEQRKQIPRTVEDIISMVQKDQKLSKTDARQFIYDQILHRKETPSPDVSQLVQNQQALKGISTGDYSKKMEDYSAAALNMMQMRTINDAMMTGGGGKRGGSWEDRFDKLLMLRMLPREENILQVFMAILPLLVGGNNQQAVQQAMTKLESYAKETESKYTTLISDLQNKLFQKDVIERQEQNQENMLAFMQEIANSNERVVGTLSQQLANLRPADGNSQVQAALTTLGAYQDFLNNTRTTLQNLGLSPEEANKATEEATAGKAKHYLMTQIGNFLGGLGQTFLAGSVTGPPLPPGYQGYPQQLNYYPAPTGYGMPQPTYPQGQGYPQSPTPSLSPQYQQGGVGVPNGPEGMSTTPTEQGVPFTSTQPPYVPPQAPAQPTPQPPSNGIPPMPQPGSTPQPTIPPKQKGFMPAPTFPPKGS